MTYSDYRKLNYGPVKSWVLATPMSRLTVYAVIVGLILGVLIASAQASHFNKPTCGWWLPHEGDRPINLGPCPTHLPYGSSVTITLPNGTSVTVPVGGNDGGSKPGHGYGDTNHSHSGPPGQDKK